MQKRSRIALGLAGLVLAAGALASGPPTPPAGGQASARPNFVVIQADDQSLEMMRVMERTNRLLGDRGATFRNHFANWPVCCPSRVTQLTAQYAHNHGVLGNGPPLGGYRRFDREDNLAVWLAAGGYEVAHVGKFLNGYGPRRDRDDTPYNDVTEVPPGWTDWRTGSAGTTYTFYGYAQNEWSGEPNAPRDGDLVDYDGAADDFKTDVNTDDAVDLIDGYAGPGNPFYLQVDYLAPHSGGPRSAEDMPQPPFDCGRQAKPAPRHAHAFDDEPLMPAEDPSFNEGDVSDKPPFVQDLPEIDNEALAEITGRYRCRLESTLAIDEGVQRIVGKLRQEGELDNTYVIYTSDNGFFHGEHRIRNGKTEVYEPSIRLPLLMRGPDVPAGVRVNELTTNADLPATVIALTGATSDGRRPADGRSLIGAVDDPREETGRELLIETNKYTAIRTQRYKRVEYTDDGFVEVYDLERDPSELQNVASDPAYQDVAGALAARLAALRTCAGSGCKARPALRVRYKQVPQGRDCIARGLRVVVNGADAPRVAEARFYARGKPAGVDRKPPIKKLIKRGKLAGRGDAGIRTEATLVDGRRVTWLDSFRVCR